MRQNIGAAYDLVQDNMGAVRHYVDSAPFVDLPGEDEKIQFSVLVRFANLRELARKFAPEKFEIVSRLERLTKRLQVKAISPNAFFSEVKHIALQNQVSPDFIEKVERQLFQYTNQGNHFVRNRKQIIKPFILQGNFQSNFQKKNKVAGQRMLSFPNQKSFVLPKFRFHGGRK
jgi:hypothetical protein